jgi:type VI secretion system protein VasD
LKKNSPSKASTRTWDTNLLGVVSDTDRAGFILKTDDANDASQGQKAACLILFSGLVLFIWFCAMQSVFTWGVLLFCLILPACGTPSKMAETLMVKTGLKNTVPGGDVASSRPVMLNLHAGTYLNSGHANRSSALVAKIYKLKKSSAFYAAPYEAFLSPEKEKLALGDDLVSKHEVNMIPGQMLQISEDVPGQSHFVGVVALFRAPAPQRWRVAFATAQAQSRGITLGLHSCALTLGRGAAPDLPELATTLATVPPGCHRR